MAKNTKKGYLALPDDGRVVITSAVGGSAAQGSMNAREVSWDNVKGEVTNNGFTIEWDSTSLSDLLSDREKMLILEKTGWKKIQAEKCLQVKALMRTKKRAAIVKYFKGKRGYKTRTIAAIYAALSEANAW